MVADSLKKLPVLVLLELHDVLSAATLTGGSTLGATAACSTAFVRHPIQLQQQLRPQNQLITYFSQQPC